MPNPPALAKFKKLVDDISRIYEKACLGQLNAAREMGRYIFEVEQDGEIRAEYGSGLLQKLSDELSRKYGSGFSHRNLLRMRQFYLAHPISPVPAKLDWTDYVELMPIKDAKTRRRLEQRILKEKLNSAQIRQIVSKIRHAPDSNSAKKLPPLKRPADLKLNTYAKSALKAKLREGYVLLDCGFFVNWPVEKSELSKLDVSAEPSYTYVASVERVVDGDTLLVLVDVGFGIIMHDKLRLRGINTPELGLPEGEKAKRYVTNLLPADSTIVLKSHKSKTDIYGRFVVDVFFKSNTEDPAEIISKGIYLNQHLLDEGYAVRMKE